MFKETFALLHQILINDFWASILYSHDTRLHLSFISKTADIVLLNKVSVCCAAISGVAWMQIPPTTTPPAPGSTEGCYHSSLIPVFTNFRSPSSIPQSISTIITACTPPQIFRPSGVNRENLVHVNTHSEICDPPAVSHTSDLKSLQDFKSCEGLKLLHLNVRSLLPKLDLVQVLITEACPDIFVFTREPSLS